MAKLHEVMSECLADKKITDADVQTIREYIEQDGQLDLSDVQFLTELLSHAESVCPAFDELFFPVLKHVILADGEISQAEQFYLLKMLYSDGHIREREKQFLAELRREAKHVPPAFEELCETAMGAKSQGWDVGGSPR